MEPTTQSVQLEQKSSGNDDTALGAHPRPLPPGRPGVRRPHIVVVGVCASGKSTLKEGLLRLGYSVECVAQEHTLVKRLWRRSRPDVLIALHCSHNTIKARRNNPRWPRARFEEQLNRLEDARRHAHVTIETDRLTPARLVERAVAALGALRPNEWGLTE